MQIIRMFRTLLLVAMVQQAAAMFQSCCCDCDSSRVIGDVVNDFLYGDFVWAGCAAAGFTSICASCTPCPVNCTAADTPADCTAQACTDVNVPYTGCTALCTRPTSDIDGVVFTDESQLEVANTFTVTLACAPGYAGSATAQPCSSSGAYTIDNKCTACTDGSFSTDGNGACTDVNAGSFGSTDGSTHATTGATQQVACLDGSFNLDGTGECDDVPAGSFGSVDGSTHATTGATQQVACADGTRNADGTGACDATLCLVDQFVQRNVCTPCSLGFVNPQGDDASKSDTSCVPATKLWLDTQGFRGSNCANPESSAVACGSELTIHPAFNGTGVPTCYPDKTFEEAELLCSRAVTNGRLCTSPEVEDGVTTGTGCGYDNERIWTSTSCGDGKHITKLGKGGGKCGINKMNSKEMCSEDSYVAGGVRCCAGKPEEPRSIASGIEAGATTIKMNDVSGIKKGQEITISGKETEETTRVVAVNRIGNRSRRDDEAGDVTVDPPIVNSYAAEDTTVLISTPPSFVWGSMRGCCRAVDEETRFSPPVAATQAFLDSTSIADATINCTATCAVDEMCTAVEVSKRGKKYPARCEFFTNTQISSSSRATKSCKKAECSVKKDHVAPTGPPSPLIQTLAPTAAPTTTPSAWNELRGCCRENTGKKLHSHHNTATTVQLAESNNTAAAAACKQQCSDDFTCTAAELTKTKNKKNKKNKKSKAAVYMCELHTASGINAVTRASRSCKKATCSIKT